MPNFDRRSGFATAYGIYYETAGTGDWLVFLHSEQTDARLWDDQFHYFAPKFAVLRYDFQGYGRSKLTNKRIDHTADMLRVLDTLGLRDFHLVGASMGGRIALDFALRHPERVRTLALLGTQVSGYTPAEEAVPAQAAVFQQAFDAGNLNLASELSLQMWLDGVGRGPDAVDAEVRRRLHQMNKINLRGEKYVGRREIVLEGEDTAVSRLSHLKIPTLAIVGELDQPQVIELTAQLASEMPNAHKMLIPNTAHYPSLEKPDEINQILHDFWRQGT